MQFKLKSYLTVIIVYSVIILHAGFALAQAKEAKFIYDPKGKKDPFVPFIDNQTSTGLRTGFIPPKVEVKLPMEINVEGIVTNGREYFAIINKEVMQKGDKVGQVQIKQIEKDKVILEYGEREFEVLLRKEKEK